jgi:hypothetical protein
MRKYTKITAGEKCLAMAKRVFTIFSPSPILNCQKNMENTHLLVRELAEILKNVDFD